MRRFQPGFTLIELIVVIGVIGVLSSIVITAVNPAQLFAKARDSDRRNATRQIRQAILTALAETGNTGPLATLITNIPQPICNGDSGVTCQAGTINLRPYLVPNHLPDLILDPVGGIQANIGYYVFRNKNNQDITVYGVGDLEDYIWSGTLNNGLTFDGTDDYAKATNLPSAFNIGTGDFTLEGWAKITPGNISGGSIAAIGHAGGFTGISLGYQFGGKVGFTINYSGIAEDLAEENDGEWHHLAGVRKNGVINLYVDGRLKASAANANDFVLTPEHDKFYIGGGPFDHFPGTVDEVRLSKIPRYTANFTPQKRFRRDSSTIGLWHLEEGGGIVSADFSENHASVSLTNSDTNSPAANGTTVGPLWTEGVGLGILDSTALWSRQAGPSLKFDPTIPPYGKYVTTTDASSLSVTGDTTIEAWVKPLPGNAEGGVIVASNIYSWGGLGAEIMFNGATKKFRFAADIDGTDYAVESAKMYTTNQNKWYHVAGVRKGTTLSIFVNGEGTNIPVSGGAIRQGGRTVIGYGIYNSAPFYGLIDEVRISKVARYINEFSRPNGPFGADTDTVGLWHFDEGNGQVLNDVSTFQNNGKLGPTNAAEDTDPAWYIDPSLTQ